eukprot:6505919-Prorocentrum_lima.AAC.1
MRSEPIALLERERGELLIRLHDHGIAVADQGFDDGGTGLLELVHIISLCLSGLGVFGRPGVFAH